MRAVGHRRDSGARRSTHRHRHGVARQHRDRVGIAPAVGGEFHDAVLRVPAGGETGDAHRHSLARLTTGILRCMSPPDISAQGTAFHAVDIIRAKCDGIELSAAQIDWIIAAYTAAEIADEQMAALAMAVLFRGLSRHELDCWTRAMINSGERLDFSGLSRPTVDKHSTGGVGDKITLPLVPLVAVCGAAVPRSSRGLGHTGGTLDKLGQSLGGGLH